MKKRLFLPFFYFPLVLLSVNLPEQLKKISLDDDWKFHLGHAANLE